MTFPKWAKPRRKVSGTFFPASSKLFIRLTQHPFLFVLGLLTLLIGFGVTGYVVIEGWTVTDALYMTVITMTTIGYGEVKTLSYNGRLFTMVLIIIGVLVGTYAVTATIELFTSQEFIEQIRTRRRRSALEKFQNHTIICGYGRLGRSLSKELLQQGSPLVVIDLIDEVAQQARQEGFPAIVGSGADEALLEEAGIRRAKALVAAAKSDAENVFIVLTARSINPNLQIIARSNRDSSIPKLETAGANTVISPFSITGQRIANMIMRPNVVDFLDGILRFGNETVRLEEFIIQENSKLAGLTLKEAKLKVAVLAVDHPGEMVYTHPNADTRLLPGTAIVVMGVEEELSKLTKLVQ
ncbi:MAG: potassium channel protein [Anaerolineae bacterium]|nr:potassium channel protein [Anaerolineae bacterium]